MKSIRLALAALFACVAVTAAQAGASYYQPTPDLTALAAYGTASPYVLHAWVQSATVQTNTGGASYTWNASCPGAPGDGRYIAATGVGSGCWVFEGFAVAGGSGFVTLATQQALTGPKAATWVTVTPSTATFTPNFNTQQNLSLTLSSACPCTLANPSTTPVPGQSGTIRIYQDATGSRVINTWGSQYVTAGGVSTLALSTAANARDFFAYLVDDTSHIVLTPAVLNATH